VHRGERSAKSVRENVCGAHGDARELCTEVSGGSLTHSGRPIA